MRPHMATVRVHVDRRCRPRHRHIQRKVQSHHQHAAKTTVSEPKSANPERRGPTQNFPAGPSGASWLPPSCWGVRLAGECSADDIRSRTSKSRKPKPARKQERTRPRTTTIHVIRTPTVRKIRSRVLPRQCPRESIGAAAEPDGMRAGKLEPKMVTETGAAVVASWRQLNPVQRA